MSFSEEDDEMEDGDNLYVMGNTRKDYLQILLKSATPLISLGRFEL